MDKKAGAERASVEKNCSGKKAKVTAEAEAAVSKITLTVDPKLLECSGCCSPLVPPIFQCTNGHITCLKCCADLKRSSCGLCALERTGCHAWGRILGGLTMPCSFQEHGCTETIRFTEKLAHEESCLHAPCHCPIAGCRPYHGRMRNDEPARLVSLGSRAVFLLVVDRSIPSGCALSVIHLMSDPIEKEDFNFQVQDRSAYEDRRSLSVRQRDNERRAAEGSLPGGCVAVRLGRRVVSPGFSRVPRAEMNLEKLYALQLENLYSIC
ncbi:hypothetical protein ZWY2020_031519 [Hordeum vulgare]|nr:hypothetical protein ZWY2020_031519 [Hordeum vulgare]